jgi:glutamate--cysteine ligase
MTERLNERLKALPPGALAEVRRGIEKESLRVRPDGELAATAHPPALGSALTHPNITTDFSEAQLELITGVHSGVDACLQELTEIHQFVYRVLGAQADSGGSEVLWCSSMPCNLPPDEHIPIGRYGHSNVGRAKSVYRTGLAHRYGSRMQTISGIHYNFSLPGLSTEDYFALIRNFRRASWLPLYLFGASPAVCSSFAAGRSHALQPLSADTLYLPHATSLRMGRLGYQSDAQSALCVSYNSLESYAASLHEALTRPYPPYEAIGVRKGDEYLQLSTTLLQIENEFYSTVRPKRRIRAGERPLHALRERGVEYVEVRLMDLDPFNAVGISAPTMHLLDCLLLHCLLAESPPDTPREIGAVARNQHSVAARGREPGLVLDRGGKPVALLDWGLELLAECAPIAGALDAAHGGGAAHRDALAHAIALLKDPAGTPSARVLDALSRNHGNAYERFALIQSLSHAGTLRGLDFPTEAVRRHEQLAAESLAEQHAIESADAIDFETYRQKYLAQDTLIIGQPRYREAR